MTLSQTIILYFFIIPIISLLILAIVESYMEDKKEAKKENMELIRRNKILNEKIEYMKYKKIYKMQFVGCTIK